MDKEAGGSRRRDGDGLIDGSILLGLVQGRCRRPRTPIELEHRSCIVRGELDSYGPGGRRRLCIYLEDPVERIRCCGDQDQICDRSRPRGRDEDLRAATFVASKQSLGDHSSVK